MKDGGEKRDVTAPWEGATTSGANTGNGVTGSVALPSWRANVTDAVCESTGMGWARSDGKSHVAVPPYCAAGADEGIARVRFEAQDPTNFRRDSGAGGTASLRRRKDNRCCSDIRHPESE